MSRASGTLQHPIVLHFHLVQAQPITSCRLDSHHAHALIRSPQPMCLPQPLFISRFRYARDLIAPLQSPLILASLASPTVLELTIIQTPTLVPGIATPRTAV